MLQQLSACEVEYDEMHWSCERTESDGHEQKSRVRTTGTAILIGSLTREQESVKVDIERNVK
jgi:hypothetical protein